MKYISILIFLSLLAVGCQENKQQDTGSSVDEMHTISATVILPDTSMLIKRERECPYYHLDHFQKLFTDLTLIRKSNQVVDLNTGPKTVIDRFQLKKRAPTDIVEIELFHHDTVLAKKFFKIHLDHVLDSINAYARSEAKAKMDSLFKRFNEIGDSLKMPELKSLYPELGHRFTYFAQEHTAAKIEYAAIRQHIKVLDPPHVKK